MARILITSGPTREPLDSVRYLSNPSSGRTGMALAEEAIRRGHEVDLVLGPVEIPTPPGARVHRVVTCAEMLAACRKLHPDCDALIGAAAVADFRPENPVSGKRNRGDGPWRIDLTPNPDILGELGAPKGRRVHAGFALETVESLDEAIPRARLKLEKKRLDWIVVNTPRSLGGDSGVYLVLGRTGPPLRWEELSKRELARRLLDLIEKTLKGVRPGADNDD